MEESESLTTLRHIPILPHKFDDIPMPTNEAFHHATILDVGKKIVRQCNDADEKRHRDSLQKCKEDCWEKAEAYKDDCVLQAIQEAKNKEERKMKRMQQENEKKVRKKLSRLEGILHHQILEKVHEERTSAEKQLNQTVAEMHEKFSIEKTTAIHDTREEERRVALQAKEERHRRHVQEVETQRLEDEAHRSMKLQQLRDTMSQETDNAVKETVQAEKTLADERITKIEARYNRLIDDLNNKIKTQEEKQRSIDVELSNMQSLKKFYAYKLKDTRHSFVEFMASHKPNFDAGQANHLVLAKILDSEDEA